MCCVIDHSCLNEHILETTCPRNFKFTILVDIGILWVYEYVFREILVCQINTSEIAISTIL